MRRDVARESTRAKDVVALTQAHNCDATDLNPTSKENLAVARQATPAFGIESIYPQRTNATLCASIACL